MGLPRDRVYFHYSHFHNAATTDRIEQAFGRVSAATPRRVPLARSSFTSRTDPNLHDPASRQVIRVVLSASSASRDPGVRVATSIQQMANALLQDGLGVGFDGVFMIEDGRHRAGASVPGGRAVPSQMRVILLAPAVATRLTATASPDARSIQTGLLAAGFTRATFVEVGKTAR